ncbi:MAG: hypothetical protein WKF75_00640 [Singulisphaera sp.]
MRVRGDLDHALLTDGQSCNPRHRRSLRARASSAPRSGGWPSVATWPARCSSPGGWGPGRRRLADRPRRRRDDRGRGRRRHPGTIAAGDVGLVTARRPPGPTSCGSSRPASSSAGGQPGRRRRATGSLRLRLRLDGRRPPVGVRVTNGDPTSPRDTPIDLHASTPPPNSTQRGSTPGRSGIRHVVIEGDLLATASPETLTFLGRPPGGPGGIRLPLDRLGGVTVQARAAPDIHAARRGGLLRRPGPPQRPPHDPRRIRRGRPRPTGEDASHADRKAAGVFQVPVGEAAGRPSSWPRDHPAASTRVRMSC